MLSRELFMAQLARLSAAFPKWHSTQVVDLWWTEFCRMDGATFRDAVSQILRQEFPPKPAMVFEYAQEARKRQVRGLDDQSIQKIQTRALEAGIRSGEAAQLISWQFGWQWRDIPSHAVDDVIAYLETYRDEETRGKKLDEIRAHGQSKLANWPEGKRPTQINGLSDCDPQRHFAIN